MNGIVIHLMMDGLVGSFARFKVLLPPMTDHYSVLDKRFLAGEPHALTVTMTELFVMCPLSLLAYRGRVLGKAYTPVIEATVSGIQLSALQFCTLK